jgi:hypothetical protein
MRKSILLVVALLAVLSCRAKPSLLVLLDPYSRVLLESRGLGPAAIHRGLGGRFRLQVLVLDPVKSPLTAAERLLAGSRSGWVYLSPLLPLDSHALASSFPAARIVQEGVGPGPEPNLVQMVFEREEAFRRAGRAAARILALQALQPILAAGLGGAASLKAAVVLAQPPMQARRQAQAFRDGFSEAADRSLLLEQDLGSLSDTARARRILESLREQGACIFLLQTYGLTGFCLEYLRSQGGLAVLEEPAAGAAYEEQVVLSLQEDLVSALSLLGETPDQTVIRGPVRLVWGKPVLALTPEARAELDE